MPTKRLLQAFGIPLSPRPRIDWPIGRLQWPRERAKPQAQFPCVPLRLGWQHGAESNWRAVPPGRLPPPSVEDRAFRLAVLALRPINEGQAVEDVGDAGVAFSENLLPDCQRALVERLRVSVSALPPIKQCQIGKRPGHVSVVRAFCNIDRLRHTLTISGQAPPRLSTWSSVVVALAGLTSTRGGRARPAFNDLSRC